MHPSVTEPTRFTNNSNPSLLDNIYISHVTNPISGNILENISYDHLPNFVIFDSKLSKNKRSHIQVRETKNFNEENFLNDLNFLNLQTEKQHIDFYLHSNCTFDYLNKNFQTALNKHAPIKVLSKKETKLRLKPWLTKGILTSMKIKRNLFSLFKESKCDEYYIRYRTCEIS